MTRQLVARDIRRAIAALERALVLLDQLEVEPGPDPSIELLSKRELDVLFLMDEGMTDREIGQRLGISIKTVSRHAQHIYKRLAVQPACAFPGRA